MPCFVHVGAWRKAVHVCLRYARADLLESDVQPAMQRAFGALEAQLVATRDTYAGLLARLGAVRARKDALAARAVTDPVGDGEEDVGGDAFPDYASITSRGSRSTLRSHASHTTGRSRRTAHTRPAAKVLERKRRAASKPGGPLEEWFVLDALHQQLSTYPGLRGTVACARA